MMAQVREKAGPVVADASIVEAANAPFVETIREKDLGEKLYWIGALPRPGRFKFPVATAKQTLVYNGSSEYIELVEVSASDLWNRRVGSERTWQGKCPYYEHIVVCEHTFPSSKARMIRDDNGGIITITPDYWPGMVVKWSKDEFKDVLAKIKRTFLHEENGRAWDKLDIHQLPRHQARITNIDRNKAYEDWDGKSPDRMPVGHVSASHAVPVKGKTTWIGEFIYIVPLSGVDIDADPESWVRATKGMDEFFANPPKSVAEAIKDLESAA